MTGLVVLVRRELAARRLVFAGSVALGLVAAATPWLAGARATVAVDVRSAATVVTSALWMFLLAVGSGVTTWAHDLGEGRLAFDYRLPVPAVEIWLARLGVALFSVFAAGGLVIVAAAPFGLDLSAGFDAVDVVAARWLRDPSNALGAWVVGLFLVPLILLGAHFLALIPRASRGWTLGALTAVVVAKLVVTRIVWSVEHFDGRATGWWVTALAIEVTVACGLVATLAQALRGRSELDVSHRIFSLGLIGTAALVIAAGLVWRWHYVHPTPADLSGERLEVHPLGEHRVAMAGWDGKRRRMTAFVMEPSARRWVDLGPVAGDSSEWVLRTSVDGLVAWHSRMPDGAHRMHLLRAEQWDAEPVDGASPSFGSARAWTLAPGGELVATYLGGAGGLELWSAETGARLWRTDLPGCFHFRGFSFPSPSTLEATCDARSDRNQVAMRRFEVDVSSGDVLALLLPESYGKSIRTGENPRTPFDELLRFDSSGVGRPPSPRWYDRSTGEWIPVLPHLEPD